MMTTSSNRIASATPTVVAHSRLETSIEVPPGSVQTPEVSSAAYLREALLAPRCERDPQHRSTGVDVMTTLRRRNTPLRRQSVRRPLAARSRQHLAQFLLQVGYLIAETGRELELELGGGRLHLVGELADEVSQLRCREVLELTLTLLGIGDLHELLGVGILPGEQVGDVADLLPQRRRIDAVLSVVCQLLV